MLRKTVPDPYLQRGLENLGRRMLRVGYWEQTLNSRETTLLDDEARYDGARP